MLYSFAKLNFAYLNVRRVNESNTLLTWINLLKGRTCLLKVQKYTFAHERSSVVRCVIPPLLFLTLRRRVFLNDTKLNIKGKYLRYSKNQLVSRIIEQ